MNKVLVLVADAARARTLLTDSLHRETIVLALQKDFIHPESQQKRADIIDSDAPGHVSGAGHEGGLPDRDPKQHAAEQFAKTLMQHCQLQHHQGHYQGLCLVAPANFMGLLQRQLHFKPEQLDTLVKDYTRCDLETLAQHLAAHFYQ
jgi:protein required for attachment to host cells